MWNSSDLKIIVCSARKSSDSVIPTGKMTNIGYSEQISRSNKKVSHNNCASNKNKIYNHTNTDHTETMCQNSYMGFNQNQGKPGGIIHCCASVCFCFDLGCNYTVPTILLILVIVSVWLLYSDAMNLLVKAGHRLCTHVLSKATYHEYFLSSSGTISKAYLLIRLNTLRLFVIEDKMMTLPLTKSKKHCA